jgi:hypothetical protein
MNDTAATPETRLCYPGTDSDNIIIDEEFKNLILPLAEGELAALDASLDVDGCRDPLLVWKGPDLLVDGYHRIVRCRKKVIPFRVIEVEFADRVAVRAAIVKGQLGRRNLSAGAVSYYRGKQYLERKKQGFRRDLAGGNGYHKKTAEQMAEEHHVAEKTIRRDGTFSAAVDRIVANCGIEARNLVLSREKGLSYSGMIALARLDPEEQQKFIDELQRSDGRPRKKRKKRGKSITVPRDVKDMGPALEEQLTREEIVELMRLLAEKAEGQEGQEGEAAGQERRRGRKTPA